MDGFYGRRIPFAKTMAQTGQEPIHVTIRKLWAYGGQAKYHFDAGLTMMVSTFPPIRV